MLPGKAVEGSQVGGNKPSSSPALLRCSVTLKETPSLSFPFMQGGCHSGTATVPRLGGVSVSAAILLLQISLAPKAEAPGKETLSA